MRGSALPGRGPLADILVLAWCVVWIAAGLAVAHTVGDLRSLSDTAADTGRAIGKSAGTLESLGDVPVVGGEIRDTAGQVRDAGEAITRQSDDARGGIERLALLLGLSVALVPIVPVLWSYLPSRVARERERQALRSLLSEGRGDPAFERLLAQRAVYNLSYRRLKAISDQPWRDLEDDHCGDLARAELERMGLPPKQLD